MALNLIKLMQTQCRFIHVSSCYESKAGRTMRKVIGNYTPKKKRPYTDTPILPTASTFSKGAFEGKYSGSSRRATVLNKLFMKHITDLMVTGDYCAEFAGHGIEINRVQITPDYNGLNVFWIAKGTSSDDIVEGILKMNAGYLRHELSSLRLMGVVPTIRFVKDKQYSQIVELDSRLAQADFGEDYEPVQMEIRLKSQLELLAPLPIDIKEQIKKIDGESTEELEEPENPLPPMPQDVMGLNHADILNRVLKAMKKSESIHRLSSNTEESDLLHIINADPVTFASNRAKRLAFQEFLEKRELIRSKSKKIDKNYLADLEYMEQEMKEHQSGYFKNMDVYEDHIDDTDYLSEEER